MLASNTHILTDRTHPSPRAPSAVAVQFNPLVELADMREANRSYESNLQVIKQARDLISMTIDLLRSNS